MYIIECLYSFYHIARCKMKSNSPKYTTDMRQECKQRIKNICHSAVLKFVSNRAQLLHMCAFHLKLVDLIVDHVVDFRVEASWQAFLCGELIDDCE